MEHISQDVKEIKGLVIDLVKQGATHNELLRQHEARSLALQKGQELLDVRFKPVETHIHGINIFLKLIGAVATGCTVYVLSQYLIRHLLA